uniref:Serpin domain-containing protein n=1 Tax=Anopheles atroparvus TaxID=41427 RepID=A0A182J156_ANOAO
MIWILLFAALAAHVSCYDSKEVIRITKQEYCEKNRIRNYKCEESFANYLVAYPQLKQCTMACPLFSDDCPSLSIDSQCTSSYNQGTEHSDEDPENQQAFEEPASSGIQLHSKVTKFTLELFKKAVPIDNAQNYVLSPVLVQSLLAYLTDGASNGTRGAMESVLQLTASDLNELKRLIEPSAERVDSSKNKLDIASQIFRSSRIELLRPYVQSLKNRKVPQQPMDFSNKENAAKTINDWVKQNTRGKILEAIDAESLNPETQLLLLNALYFNGTWMYKFNRTERGTFHVNDNEQSAIRMMYLTRNLRSGYTRVVGEWKPKEGFLWVELPYDGDTVSMILLLPKERFQLDRELQTFNEQDLEYILSEIAANDQDEVRLRLPEFKAESTVSLVEPLKRMGLASVFDGEKPFDKISNDIVKISEVKQKSFLSVDQRGTVATSVTYATVIALSLPRSMEFYVDQPFAAIIIDKTNKLPLFMAKISKPEKFKKEKANKKSNV